MKTSQISATLLLLTPLLALFSGCGGGGGSSPSPTPIPTITTTPTVGARVLVVQLRDAANNPVDGVVSIGTAPVAGVSILATSGGSATFNRSVAAGAVAVSAEVDDIATVGTAFVNPGGTTIFTLLITPSVVPVPSATLPPPPFPG